MKLEKIVLCVDFSASSVGAAQWAVQHLAPSAEFLALNVLQLPEPPEFLRKALPELQAARVGIHADAEARLRDLAASLPTERVAVEIAVGQPADEIARVARSVGADLVLLGPHGLGQVAWDPIGGTAEKVVRSSPVPALVARARPEGPVERVLASVNGSHLTDQVLRWASFFSRHFSAKLAVLHVLSTGLYGAARMATTPEALDLLDQRARQATQSWLTARMDAAGISAGEVETFVAFGDPKHEIIDVAAEYDADLLVMGSRGAEEVGPAHLGAVAASVLRGADASVLVVPDSQCDGAAE